MGKPVIFSGANAKLIPSGDLVDAYDNSLTNGDKITVTQAAHGFTSSDVGRPLYLNGSTWTLARAHTTASAEVAGFIYAVIDSNTLRIATSGQCPSVGANFLDGGGSLTAGTVYFLSGATAGKVTATEPTTVGYISKPIAVATSTTAVQFFNFRGSKLGSAKFDTVEEFTSTNGVQIKGRTSGTAIASGYVGELIGVLDTGIDSFTYSFYDNTVPTNAWASVISTTLNKGIYLVMVTSYAENPDTNSREYLFRIKIGGSVFPNTYVYTTLNLYEYSTLSITIPITITASSVAVDLQVLMAGVVNTVTSAEHCMWIMRIA